MRKINLSLPEEKDFKFNEAIKTLRTNIQFSGSKVKTVLVTSTAPNEGKSSVSIELAHAFATSGKRTLFIDADIRKSVIVGRYSIKDEVVGLSQILSGQVSIDDGIYETEYPNLNVIFAGPYSPNPTELFEDEMCWKLFKTVKDMGYDYIVIDSAPLGSVIDAAILARFADGAALVVESEVTRKRMLKKVKEQLDRTGIRFLGVILNKVKMDKGSYYSSYYYGSGEYGRKYDSYYAKE